MKKIAMMTSAALAAGLIAAGCGSSDDNNSSSSDSTSTAALTKAEFLAQGNAICTAGNQKLDAAFQSLGKNSTPEQISQVTTEQIVPTINDELDQIRALGAPAGDEQQVSAILDEADSASAKLEADPSLGAGGSDPFAQANKLAKEYGLTVCAS